MGTTLKSWLISFKGRWSSAESGELGAEEVCPWPLLPRRGVDLPLIFGVFLLVLFGLLMVYSASFIYAQERTGDGFALIKKQFLFALIGLGAMLGTARLDYRLWGKHASALLVFAIVLLALLWVPGVGARVGGAQRWLRLGTLSFQPGEFAKFAVLIFVAKLLERKQERLHRPLASLGAPFLWALPVLVLLMAQPDFGTTMMIVLVTILLQFIAGVRLRYLGVAGLVTVAFGALAILGSSYRRARLLTFMDPWSDPMGKGFQVIQSLLGLHNGGLWGVGLGNSKEKLFYLPEAHNDFIVAVIGEELGFIGVAGLLAAYGFVLLRGLQISWRAYSVSRDRFALYLGSGITLALAFQGLTNIAVVLGLLPTKGLNLPLVSYGGSALVVDLFFVGVLLSLGSSRRSNELT